MSRPDRKLNIILQQTSTRSASPSKILQTSSATHSTQERPTATLYLGRRSIAKGTFARPGITTMPRYTQSSSESRPSATTSHIPQTNHNLPSGIETDILGFVAVDIPAREIILSVRGSSSLTNWLTDVLWAREPTALCEGCWAHHGFLRAYSEIAPAATAAVASAAALFPGYRVTATGHSLGGAVATLLAAAQPLRGAGGAPVHVRLAAGGQRRAGRVCLVGPGPRGG